MRLKKGADLSGGNSSVLAGVQEGAEVSPGFLIFSGACDPPGPPVCLHPVFLFPESAKSCGSHMQVMHFCPQWAAHLHSSDQRDRFLLPDDTVTMALSLSLALQHRAEPVSLQCEHTDQHTWLHAVPPAGHSAA